MDPTDDYCGGIVNNTMQSILCQRSPPCGNSPPSDKNRKVHKMCARYCKTPDIKFRRELGFGPIVYWFDPTPVLSAMMLPAMQSNSARSEEGYSWRAGFIYHLTLHNTTTTPLPCLHFCPMPPKATTKTKKWGQANKGALSVFSLTPSVCSRSSTTMPHLPTTSSNGVNFAASKAFFAP